MQRMERSSSRTAAAGTFLRLFQTIFENTSLWRLKRLVTLSTYRHYINKCIYLSRIDRPKPGAECQNFACAKAAVKGDLPLKYAAINSAYKSLTSQRFAKNKCYMLEKLEIYIEKSVDEANCIKPYPTVP